VQVQDAVDVAAARGECRDGGEDGNDLAQSVGAALFGLEVIALEREFYLEFGAGNGVVERGLEGGGFASS